MGLMPWDFWRLTVREFWLKHDAFVREENRKEAAQLYQTAQIATRMKGQHRNQLIRAANSLKRYPVKPWLMEAD